MKRLIVSMVLALMAGVAIGQDTVYIERVIKVTEKDTVYLERGDYGYDDEVYVEDDLYYERQRPRPRVSPRIYIRTPHVVFPRRSYGPRPVPVYLPPHRRTYSGTRSGGYGGPYYKARLYDNLSPEQIAREEFRNNRIRVVVQVPAYWPYFW